jgi:hypothetical protein
VGPEIILDILFGIGSHADHVFGGKTAYRGLLAELGGRSLALGTELGGLIPCIHITAY